MDETHEQAEQSADDKQEQYSEEINMRCAAQQHGEQREDEKGDQAAHAAFDESGTSIHGQRGRRGCRGVRSSLDRRRDGLRGGRGLAPLGTTRPTGLDVILDVSFASRASPHVCSLMKPAAFMTECASDYGLSLFPGKKMIPDQGGLVTRGYGTASIISVAVGSQPAWRIRNPVRRMAKLVRCSSKLARWTGRIVRWTGRIAH